MQRPERVNWKDTNLALIGSELDHKVKEAAAGEEAAWDGIGQEPEVRVWRIEKFKVVPWPKEQYGEFFRGDSYIVMNSYKKGDSEGLAHDIHIWIGSESSQDEYGAAAYKMVEADDSLGGVPVQHREVEGSESKRFKNYFTTLSYAEGGVESGFNHVEAFVEKPLLFRVKGRKNLTLSQMPLSKSSLNEGDSFILFGGKANVWCWHGQKANPMEKASCNNWAEHMCTMGTVTVLDQGDGDEEATDFWNFLGDGEIGPAVEDDEGVTEFAPLLFRVDGDPSKELEQVATGTPNQKTAKVSSSLDRSSLDNSDVFLLDSGWEIFVWIGSGANLSEKVSALGAVDRYAKIEPRAVDLPVTLLKAGQETDLFNSYFS